MVVLLVTEDDRLVPPALCPIRSHLAKAGNWLRCSRSSGPISVMPGLLGLTVTGHASTPLLAMPPYPTERACPGRTRFRAEPQLASAANEVDERILRLNISRWGARRQKIDHSDRLDTTEGHHADHDTDDIGPDQC